MLYEFGKLRSPEVKKVLDENPLVILPVGQVEEHGLHLPIHTDCLIASELARAVAERLGEKTHVLLMDLIPYGYSGKTMMRWAGTMQVRMDTIREYVYDVCASLADMGVKKIGVINQHGHHHAIMELLARRLADEKGVAPAILNPAALVVETLKEISQAGSGGSCHAGEFETSIMLFLQPELVEMSALEESNPIAEEMKPPAGVFWSTWERQKTENGIYGTPSAATAETGKILFETMITGAVKFLEKYHKA